MASRAEIHREHVLGLALLRKAMRAAEKETDALSRYCATLEEVNDRLDDENRDHFATLQHIGVRAREGLDAVMPDASFLLFILEDIVGWVQRDFDALRAREKKGGADESKGGDAMGQRGAVSAADG